jgi:hypothetical protein
MVLDTQNPEILKMEIHPKILKKSTHPDSRILEIIDSCSLLGLMNASLNRMIVRGVLPTPPIDFGPSDSREAE